MLLLQNQRLERLVKGLRDRTLGRAEEDPEYRSLCQAIDDYRCAGLGPGDTDFPAILEAIADLIEAHLAPCEEGEYLDSEGE